MPVIVRIVSHPTAWGSLTAAVFLPKVGHPRDSVGLQAMFILANRENVKGGASTSHPTLPPFTTPKPTKKTHTRTLPPRVPNQPA